MGGVRRREVFYLSGYDPRGARYYHSLYKNESLKEEAKGDSFNVGKRERLDEYLTRWKVTYRNTRTNYHFLEWDDIIRERWDKNFIALFFDMFYVLDRYVLSGSIGQYMKASPIQMITAFYPVFYLLGTVIVTLCIVVSLSFLLEPYIPVFLLFPLLLIVFVWLIMLFTKLGNKLAVFWLLRIYVFAARYVETDDSKLYERMSIFAEYIVRIIENADAEEIDEILIVSHSVGTIITIPVLARVFSMLQDKGFEGKRISLLTLGECIPIVSFLPDAHSYREEMAQVACYPNLIWLDYTTPIDGACFPLLDFYELSSVQVSDTDKPSYLSPRFHTLFTLETYKKIKKNRYLTHFIYLMSTELKGRYNFFMMTAGDKEFLAYKNKIKDI